jgi:hypothetical protein
MLLKRRRHTGEGRSGGERCLILLSTVAAVFLGAFTGFASTADADGVASMHSDVLCGGANSLVYRFRPTVCDLHDRRDPIGSQVGYTLTRRLHWLHWGQRSATARGEIEYPMEGWFRAGIRLSDPRPACGHEAFTKARLRLPGRVPHTLEVPLDRCPLSAALAAFLPAGSASAAAPTLVLGRSLEGEAEVSSMQTTRRSIRTASGIGVGTRKRRLERELPSLSCYGPICRVTAGGGSGTIPRAA